MMCINRHHCCGAVDGEWSRTAKDQTIPDPLNGEPFISYPDITEDETAPFIESLRAIPKTGMHNPLKNPERYLMYGAISARIAEEMRKPEVPPPPPLSFLHRPRTFMPLNDHL